MAVIFTITVILIFFLESNSIDSAFFPNPHILHPPASFGEFRPASKIHSKDTIRHPEIKHVRFGRHQRLPAEQFEIAHNGARLQPLSLGKFTIGSSQLMERVKQLRVGCVHLADLNEYHSSSPRRCLNSSLGAKSLK